MCYINGKTYADNDIYYGSKALVLNIVIPLMLLVFLKYFRTNKNSFRTNIFLLFFVVWSFISTLASPYKMNSLFGWPFRWQGAVTYFMYFVLFSFVLTFLKPDKVRFLLICIYTSAAIIAIYGILEYYHVEPLRGLFFDAFDIDLVDGAIRSTIGNRNFFGSYMTLLSLTTVFIFLTKTDRKESRLYFFLSILFFAGLVASLTRGVWLGFIGAFVFMLFLIRDRSRKMLFKLIPITIAFVIVSGILTLTGQETPIMRFDSTMADIEHAREGEAGRLGSGRVYIYKRTLEVLLKKPLLGTGPDNLAYYLPLTREESRKYFGNESTICIDKSHSEYLEYAATMGLPGLALYLWFITSMLLPAIKNRRRLEPASWGILSGIVGYLLQATFNIGVISVLPLFFIYLAVLQVLTVNSEVQA